MPSIHSFIWALNWTSSTIPSYLRKRRGKTLKQRKLKWIPANRGGCIKQERGYTLAACVHPFTVGISVAGAVVLGKG
jgi:hypothetical protein